MSAPSLHSDVAGRALMATLVIQASAAASVMAPTAVAPVITQAMALPSSAIGLYIAILYVGAMSASVLSSHALVRYGAIRTSQWALVLCAIGLALLCSGRTTLAVLGTVALGLGYGSITPASSKILARTTASHRIGLVFSVKQTGVPLGGVIVGFTIPPLTLASGWPGAMLFVAIATLACAWLVQPLRARLDDDRVHGAARWPRTRELLGPVRMVWSIARLRVLAACSLVLSAVQVSLTAYLVTYLNQQLLWSLVAAGIALSVSQAAGVAGRVLWGWIADRGLGEKHVMIALCTVILACGLAMPLLDAASPQVLVFIVVIVYGGTAIGWNGVFLAAVARLAPSGQVGLATGGTLAITYLGVVVGPLLFGLIALPPLDYGWAFALSAVPLLLCLLALRRLDGRAASAEDAVGAADAASERAATGGPPHR